MKAVKIIGGVALGLIAIAAFVSYFLLSNLDDIVKEVVQEVGSKVTGTNVKVQSVKIDLKNGTGRIKGLTIANPKGYKSKHAFKFQNIVLGIDPASLSGPVVVITRAKIDGARLIAEQKGGKSNLSELLAKVEKSSKKKGKKSKEVSEPTSADELRLMVEKFSFTNTEATVMVEGQDEKVLKLPNVTRKNIGDKETGLTADQLSQRILRSLIKGVESAVGEYLGKVATDAVEAKLTENMDAEDKSKVDGLKSLFNKDE